MPPCRVEWIIRAPALDGRAVRRARVVLKDVRRTRLELVVELGEGIHVRPPSI